MKTNEQNVSIANTVRLRKEDFLKNAPLFINEVKVQNIYTPETALVHLHMHDFVEISIVVSGKGIHHSLLQTSECTAGDIYIVNSDTPHAYFAKSLDECPTVCNVIFDPKEILDHDYYHSWQSKYCYNVFYENGMIAYTKLQEKSLSFITDTVERMDQELKNRSHEWKQALKAYLINILILASRTSSTDGLQHNISSKGQDIVQIIMKSVIDNYSDQNLSLKKISNKLYVSKSHAGRIFRDVSGVNFSDYIRQVRMEKASQLLLETDFTNEQIAFNCGIRDIPTFYRQFKKHTGMTPFEYRRNMAKN